MSSCIENPALFPVSPLRNLSCGFTLVETSDLSPLRILTYPVCLIIIMMRLLRTLTGIHSCRTLTRLLTPPPLPSPQLENSGSVCPRCRGRLTLLDDTGAAVWSTSTDRTRLHSVRQFSHRNHSGVIYKLWQYPTEEELNGQSGHRLLCVLFYCFNCLESEPYFQSLR